MRNNYGFMCYHIQTKVIAVRLWKINKNGMNKRQACLNQTEGLRKSVQFLSTIYVFLIFFRKWTQNFFFIATKYLFYIEKYFCF